MQYKAYADILCVLLPQMAIRQRLIAYTGLSTGRSVKTKLRSFLTVQIQQILDQFNTLFH